MTATRPTIAAAITTVITLAGCSIAAHPAPRSGSLPVGFLAKANAVCASAVRVQAAHPFPLGHFNARHPDSAQLPILAAYFRSYGRSHQLAEGLAALGTPTAHAGEWRQLLTLVTQLSATADAQIAAAQRRDVTAFEASLATSAALQRRIGTIGTALGFRAHDACAREYG